MLIASETEEEERSGGEEATEEAFSTDDKRVDLLQHTSPGELRPRPSRKLFSPVLPQEEFASRYRESAGRDHRAGCAVIASKSGPMSGQGIPGLPSPITHTMP